MSYTREILTFQFGSYANYVGAHFWNQQEANFVYPEQSSTSAEDQLTRNDILYREGINKQKQTTYTPRLLCVDLDGSLGHIPVVGELYGNFIERDELTAFVDGIVQTKAATETNNLSTQHEINLCEQPAAVISEYQRDLSKGAVNTQKDYQLAETSQTWADFLYTRYHPRSINVLQDYKYQPNVQTLGTHIQGTELWSKPTFEEDFCDRIRIFAEECEHLQGFQLLFDIDDGFSGLASKCLEHLNDEYSRVSFALPLHQPRTTSYTQADENTSYNIRVINNVLSYYHLAQQASMFTPLSTLKSIWRNPTLESRNISGIKWQADNLYQTSAVLAAYIDTISLGYRLRQSSESLVSFIARGTRNERKLTAAAFALPFGLEHKQDLIDYLDQRAAAPLFTQLTPSCEPGNNYIIQSIVARGIPESRLKRSPQEAGAQLRMAAYGCNNISSMLQLYYQCAYHGSMTHATSTSNPLKTQLPFAYELFEDNVTSDGFMLPQANQRTAGLHVESAPALAALQNSSKLGEHIDALHAQTHRVKLAKIQRYSQAGMEREEYDAALDNLLEFRDYYNDSQYL